MLALSASYSSGVNGSQTWYGPFTHLLVHTALVVTEIIEFAGVESAISCLLRGLRGLPQPVGGKEHGKTIL
jgi:hypothetical protein